MRFEYLSNTSIDVLAERYDAELLGMIAGKMTFWHTATTLPVRDTNLELPSLINAFNSSKKLMRTVLPFVSAANL